MEKKISVGRLVSLIIIGVLAVWLAYGHSKARELEEQVALLTVSGTAKNIHYGQGTVESIDTQAGKLDIKTKKTTMQFATGTDTHVILANASKGSLDSLKEGNAVRFSYYTIAKKDRTELRLLIIRPL